MMTDKKERKIQIMLKNTDFIKKDNNELFNFHDEEIPYISYKCFDELSFVKNAFTLRMTSSNKLVYMFPENAPSLDATKECCNILASELGTDTDHRVTPFQKHTANVHVVTKADLGHPIDNRHIKNTDGLVTNIRGAHICISVADCIPLCFVDPSKKAIGIAHSGRKGTQFKIGKNVVEKMTETFGSDPKDIIATIGPGICQSCYEVGSEILTEFEDDWGIDASAPLFKEHGSKYLLDLWLANRMVLREAGLREENIITTNICNRCNSDKFYTFRGDGRIINQICASLLLL